LKIRHGQTAGWTWCGSPFEATLERCALPAIEHEEKVDHPRYNEREEKLRDGAFVFDRRLIGNVYDAPNPDNKSNCCKKVYVFRKPKPCTRPKDKETYGAQSQKRAMKNLKPSKQLSEHRPSRNVNKFSPTAETVQDFRSD